MGYRLLWVRVEIADNFVALSFPRESSGGCHPFLVISSLCLFYVLFVFFTAFFFLIVSSVLLQSRIFLCVRVLLFFSRAPTGKRRGFNCTCPK